MSRDTTRMTFYLPMEKKAELIAASMMETKYCKNGGTYSASGLSLQAVAELLAKLKREYRMDGRGREFEKIKGELLKDLNHIHPTSDEKAIPKSRGRRKRMILPSPVTGPLNPSLKKYSKIDLEKLTQHIYNAPR